jgi:hypothetical protein
MGTNFYARIIPKEEDKQKLIDAINDDRDDLIEDLASELYGHRNVYTRKGNKIHLGKRSCGWKFLWNPNVIRYADGYLDENKQYVPVYKYDYVYPLTKQGITDFCNREDIIIIDEYGEQQDPKEFLEMAFSWGVPDGWIGKTYEEDPETSSSGYRNYYWSEKYQRGMHTKADEMWFDLGYIVEYYDFEADGLRFSTSINFS